MASDTTPRVNLKLVNKIVRESNSLREEIETLKANLKASKAECDNMELAYKRAIHSKAELNDKVEQLIDDVRKFEELYVRAKGVAQALGQAVSILTTEVKNG